MLLARRLAYIFLATTLASAQVAADPIREWFPREESLVEGHVVWFSLDVLHNGTADARAAPRHAGRAEDGAGGDALLRIERFPGVVWFNDQYLVPPVTETNEGLGTGVSMRSHYAAGVAVQVRIDDGEGIREPCGGAVMAVPMGAPDPRVELAHIRLATPGVDVPPAAPVGDVRPVHLAREHDGGFDGGSRDPRLVVDTGVMVDPLTASTDRAPARLAQTPEMIYTESYRVTDPNGMLWVVDKYVVVYESGPSPVWVANMLGVEAFTPDDVMGRVPAELSPLGCREAPRAGGGLEQPLTQATCGVDLIVASFETLPSLSDTPCMGYQEPSRNGYCYRGDAAAPDCGHPADPAFREPRAFLYFEWADLLPQGELVSHADPHDPSATNGCQSGSDIPCPGEDAWDPWARNDDAEGNSHPFHPTVPPHAEAEPCPVAGAPSAANHGGSTVGLRGTCDHLHATARIDIYFSATTRPPPPAERVFTVDDLFGSADPFFDHHSAYPDIP